MNINEHLVQENRNETSKTTTITKALSQDTHQWP